MNYRPTQCVQSEISTSSSVNKLQNSASICDDEDEIFDDCNDDEDGAVRSLHLNSPTDPIDVAWNCRVAEKKETVLEFSIPTVRFKGDPEIKKEVIRTIRKVSVRRKSLVPAVDELQQKLENLKNYPVFKRVRMFLKIMKGDDVHLAIEPNTSSQDGSKNGASNNHDNSVLSERLDFTLGNDSGRLNSFISFLTSHTSYWDDLDLMEFIMKQCNSTQPKRRPSHI